jgi:hypothetical protein
MAKSHNAYRPAERRASAVEGLSSRRRWGYTRCLTDQSRGPAGSTRSTTAGLPAGSAVTEQPAAATTSPAICAGSAGTPAAPIADHSASAGALSALSASCSTACSGEAFAASEARYDPTPEFSARTNC